MDDITADALAITLKQTQERLTLVMALIAQERARRAAEIKLTPGEHLESLRAFWLAEFRAGRDVDMIDEHGARVHACDAAQFGKPWAWHLNVCGYNSYEIKPEDVGERIARAIMFPAPKLTL